jgi:phosphohistidine phosphatase SixA
LKPNSDFEQLIADLTRFQECKHILLVSHEPFLSEVLSSLEVGQGGSHLHVEFKKGALCRTEINSLSPPHPATLHWVLTPKQLRLLGKQSRVC